MNEAKNNVFIAAPIHIRPFLQLKPFDDNCYMYDRSIALENDGNSQHYILSLLFQISCNNEKSRDETRAINLILLFTFPGELYIDLYELKVLACI